LPGWIATPPGFWKPSSTASTKVRTKEPSSSSYSRIFSLFWLTTSNWAVAGVDRAAQATSAIASQVEERRSVRATSLMGRRQCITWDAACVSAVGIGACFLVGRGGLGSMVDRRRRLERWSRGGELQAFEDLASDGGVFDGSDHPASLNT
jgi:hypothetical protein